MLFSQGVYSKTVLLLCPTSTHGVNIEIQKYHHLFMHLFFHLFFKPKLVISAQRTEIVKMVYSQTHFIYLVPY